MKGAVGRGWALLAASLLAFSGGAIAQDPSPETWAVQIVALRDYDEARTVADDLIGLGFDAHTEFAMNDGRQYVRVRVGCYHAREDAEALAELLVSRATREAVVVPRTPEAPNRGCVGRDIGFVAPDTVRQPLPGSATFVVEVDGVRGMIRYRDSAWELLQEPAAEAIAPRPRGTPRFSQVPGAPRPFVRVRDGEGRWTVCPGDLLAQTDSAAIVERDGVVMACQWRPTPNEAVE